MTEPDAAREHKAARHALFSLVGDGELGREVLEAAEDRLPAGHPRPDDLAAAIAEVLTNPARVTPTALEGHLRRTYGAEVPR